jgi:hypothetical protein
VKLTLPAVAVTASNSTGFGGAWFEPLSLTTPGAGFQLSVSAI